MFNFLDSKLLPKVTCSSPATDNYEASNLISDKILIKSRGYLAYTVIKPPVTLEFEFICPVDISYINLNTTIGKQKCSGIEIFAKNDTSTIYKSIGKAIYSKSGIVFCNSRKYSVTQPPPGFDDNYYHLSFFRSDTIRLFTNTNRIKVVIIRTERSVPCLASIEVFGVPSKTCSQVTIETINKLYNANKIENTSEVCTTETINGTEVVLPKDFQIPEDFKDDLTCEIMALPMTLPSGKTVDKETLEKHIKNEASFGRKPCDPFTGLKFNDKRKPILNVALKSRIDMFLLHNSNNPSTFNLKRTVSSCLSISDNSLGKRLRVDSDSRKCSLCEESARDLYVIPCKHFYCKKCLLGLANSKCDSCGEEFVKSDAQRHHI